MRARFALFLILSISATAIPSEPDKAKIALALAEAEHAPAAPAACYTDLRQAEAAAARHSRILMLWVVVRCCDSPEIRDGLPNAVHCHQDTFGGSAVPRVVLIKNGKFVGDWSVDRLTDKLPDMRKAASRMDWFF